ncbi:MAG TPA: UDP-N-acetylmuramoyl-L-alanyl-D-glutamate--2,6-diaminopimelate ligase [Bryobacteraceae bacterium]|nr:UDP-N-acetylmuramoyl-L-alanyl-D-glutamate--2,6-diaminopimelate ligase [Bryobacteraceae bacterium]
MTLAALFDGVVPGAALPPAVAAQEVRGLAYDSRKAGPGFVFFAFPGAKADGRIFAADAIGRGAIAVISELPGPENFPAVWIQAAHGRRTLALLAGRFYDHPDRRLHLTGITGTNGKTTTAYLMDSILQQAGKTTAMIGTVEYRLAGRRLPAVNTTPESLDLLELFAQLEREGGSHGVMEVSSHALALGRVHGIHFHTAVWTNLTRDHLDFHGSMEEYFAAKQMLFLPGESADEPRYAVVNHDDERGRQLQTGRRTEVLSYGLETGAAIRAVGVETNFEGLQFEVEYSGSSYPITSPLAGRVNVYNILAAWGAGFVQGISPEVIAAGVEALEAVPGRFERVRAGQPFLVVVDYAHTDDALRNTIATARALTGKRVVTLFGCGGDRDRAKRPLMGMAAAEGSDYVVLTSDNPRSEDPLDIINDALVGIRRYDTPHTIEPDRARAIKLAVEQADAGDVVIIAGKGHEPYQILRDRTIDFDDREVARASLAELGYGGDPS